MAKRKSRKRKATKTGYVKVCRWVKRKVSRVGKRKKKSSRRRKK